MINETLILHSPPHTCYIHIIHKLQNTSSILWKKFCTARLIEFKWSTFEFLKVIDIYGHWENYKGISGKNEMCFDWMQRTHRTWAPQAMSVWLHASKNTGYPPRISNRSELKRPFQTSLNMKSFATRCRCDIKTMFSHIEGWWQSY